MHNYPDDIITVFIVPSTTIIMTNKQTNSNVNLLNIAPSKIDHFEMKFSHYLPLSRLHSMPKHACRKQCFHQ